MVKVSHLLTQLGILLMLCCYVISAAAARPGYFYTRPRGHCTPQFWASRREAWPKMVPQRSTVSKVFGSRAVERFRFDLTLLEATRRNDDLENPYVRLLKHSSAALLNSYARESYPYKAWEVKTMLLMGLVSKGSAAQHAQNLKKANEACT